MDLDKKAKIPYIKKWYQLSKKLNIEIDEGFKLFEGEQFNKSSDI